MRLEISNVKRIEPMEFRRATEIPKGRGWLYEPKWDGFRCVAYREGEKITLYSKSGKPLHRYFPDVVACLGLVRARRFVLDGEIVMPPRSKRSFDDLLQRIHPAASRVAKLAREEPATYVAFDLLSDEAGKALFDRPLAERRRLLRRFAATRLARLDCVRVSPATTRYATAQKWLSVARGSFDGIVAKRLDELYRAGTRTFGVKIKRIRTADCVIGGFRYSSGEKLVGSLLLGLYDSDRRLNHVGFMSGFSQIDRRWLTKRLEALRKPPGFTGTAPGGLSRWRTERTFEWVPVAPRLVVEVTYDHVTGERFRHGTRFVRWRPDKRPTQCTMDQLESAADGEDATGAVS